MVPWNKCLISTVVFALAMAPVAGGGQAKTAAAPAAGAAAGAKPGPEPCANGVVAGASQVESTATEMGKTADAVGTASDKITKAFNSWRTPKPPPKPATTTTTTAAATTPAKPAVATPAKPAAPTAANVASAANAVPGAAGAAGGAGGSSAPCSPAKKELVASGAGGGAGEGKPGTAGANAAPAAAAAPIVIETPPTFTAMPDGDVMLGYVAPGSSATTYAKVKLLPAATPPPATSPHDGTYTDSKMFYTVSGGKMFVTPIAGVAAAAPGATAVAVAAKPAAVSGLVADVSGTTLIVNIGTNAGVKVGTKLDVVRPRVIKDPTTHKDLKTVDTSLGSLTITSADAMTATGMYTGTAPTKVGDTVKTPE
jgi:hypothetical protein